MAKIVPYYEKKIEFAFSNDVNPSGSMEGIGIKPGLLLREAEYYGAIKLGEDDYIVAKVIFDEFNRYPRLLGKFIVRRALCDVYADGSYVMFLDQDEDMISQKMEDVLNNPEVEPKIRCVNGVNNIPSIISNVNSASKIFKLASMDEKILATSIRTEEFNKKNEALRNCRVSMSELQMELQNDYTR